MTKKIKIHINDLTEEWVTKLKEEYENATLAIEVYGEKDQKVMNEEAFWTIIDMLDWEKGTDKQAILAPALKELQYYSIKSIYRFQDILANKLFQLDQQEIAENMGENKYRENHHFSVDTFLYARAAVVANGEAFFKKVLREPSNMLKEFTFEALLYLAADVYQQKTGAPWDYLPSPSYETYSNREGWNGKSWMDSILNVHL